VAGLLGTVSRRRLTTLAALATLVACLGLPGTASASEKLTDNAANVQLQVKDPAGLPDTTNWTQVKNS